MTNVIAGVMAGLLAVAPGRAMPIQTADPGAGRALWHEVGTRAAASSNGYGTNVANSTAVGGPVGPYGGYVVNENGFGNYVSGPAGYGGYPNGSAGAQIWRQREEWKCQNVPESC